jgi:hypothetical protein
VPHADVDLPHGSRWRPVATTRQAHPSTYIGVVTGRASTVHGTGAADFILRKPIRAAELLASLARLEASPESRTNS